jgi:hypothetical protein
MPVFRPAEQWASRVWESVLRDRSLEPGVRRQEPELTHRPVVIKRKGNTDKTVRLCLTRRQKYGRQACDVKPGLSPTLVRPTGLTNDQEFRSIPDM